MLRRAMQHYFPAHSYPTRKDALERVPVISNGAGTGYARDQALGVVTPGVRSTFPSVRAHKRVSMDDVGEGHAPRRRVLTRAASKQKSHFRAWLMYFGPLMAVVDFRGMADVA